MANEDKVEGRRGVVKKSHGSEIIGILPAALFWGAT